MCTVISSWEGLLTELEFVNLESIPRSHEPKISKTSIFYKLFFPKTLNNQHRWYLSVYLSRVKWVRLNDERTKLSKLCHKIFKLKIIIKFFSQNFFFLLIPTLVLLNVFFYLLFGCLTANGGPLSRRQSHLPNANHCVWQVSTQKSVGAL